MNLKFHIKRPILLSATLLLIMSTVFTFSAVHSRPQRQANQFEDWKDWDYYVELFLNESAGADRVLEPAEFPMQFADEQCEDASKEIRVVTENGTEIPSQVYNITTFDSSGFAKSANIAFQVNVTAYSNATYRIYYGNPDAEAPDYSSSSDLSVQTVDTTITIGNTYYEVTMGTNTQYLTSLKYKPYSETTELLDADWGWGRMLQLVTELPAGKWNLQWNPASGTNTTIEEQGPVFVEVRSELGSFAGSGITGSVVTFRFYSRIPWFIYTNDLNLSGDFPHMLVSSSVHKTILPYGFYEAADGSVQTADVPSNIGDVTDWNGTWIDVENTQATSDNQVGVSFITMGGSTPAWAGWRSDRTEVAPFFAGALIEAHPKIAIYLHEGNYSVVQQMSKALSQMLLPPGGAGVSTIISLLATIFDIVSGAASPGVPVDLKFENGSFFQQVITNQEGIAVFSDIPPGNYIVECHNVTASVVVVATTGVRLRVAVPRPEFWIYIGVGIGVCAVILAVVMIIKRRR